MISACLNAQDVENPVVLELVRQFWDQGQFELKKRTRENVAKLEGKETQQKRKRAIVVLLPPLPEFLLDTF